MPDIVIAPLAQEDMIEIGRYTQRRWGTAQRTSYLTAMASVFARLASGAIRGRARTDLREGLLMAGHGAHLIFFRRSPQGDVEILRILHERMDFPRHM